MPVQTRRQRKLQGCCDLQAPSSTSLQGNHALCKPAAGWNGFAYTNGELSTKILSHLSFAHAWMFRSCCHDHRRAAGESLFVKYLEQVKAGRNRWYQMLRVAKLHIWDSALQQRWLKLLKDEGSQAFLYDSFWCRHRPGYEHRAYFLRLSFMDREGPKQCLKLALKIVSEHSANENVVRDVAEMLSGCFEFVVKRYANSDTKFVVKRRLKGDLWGFVDSISKTMEWRETGPRLFQLVTCSQNTSSAWSVFLRAVANPEHPAFQQICRLLAAMSRVDKLADEMRVHEFADLIAKALGRCQEYSSSQAVASDSLDAIPCLCCALANVTDPEARDHLDTYSSEDDWDPPIEADLDFVLPLLLHEIRQGCYQTKTSCIRVLSSFCRRATKEQSKILVREGVLELVLKATSDSTVAAQNGETVALQACRSIQSLVRHSDLWEQVCDEGALAVVIHAMQRFPSTRREACQALKTAVITRNQIVADGGRVSFRCGYEPFASREQLMSCIQLLVADREPVPGTPVLLALAESNIEGIHSFLADQGTVRAVSFYLHSAITRFCSGAEPRMQWASQTMFKLLLNLAQNDGHACEEVFKFALGSVMQYIRLWCDKAEWHASERDVAHRIVSEVMARECSRSAVVPTGWESGDSFDDSTVASFVVNSLRRYSKDRRLQEQACIALKSLALQCTEAKVAIVGLDGVSLLKELAEADDAELRRHACAALAVLVAGSTGEQAWLKDMGLRELRAVFKDNQNDEDTIPVWCSLICRLAKEATEQMKAQLMGEEGSLLILHLCEALPRLWKTDKHKACLVNGIGIALTLVGWQHECVGKAFPFFGPRCPWAAWVLEARHDYEDQSYEARALQGCRFVSSALRWVNFQDRLFKLHCPWAPTVLAEHEPGSGELDRLQFQFLAGSFRPLATRLLRLRVCRWVAVEMELHSTESVAAAACHALSSVARFVVFDADFGPDLGEEDDEGDNQDDASDAGSSAASVIEDHELDESLDGDGSDSENGSNSNDDSHSENGSNSDDETDHEHYDEWQFQEDARNARHQVLKVTSNYPNNRNIQKHAAMFLHTGYLLKWVGFDDGPELRDIMARCGVSWPRQ